MILSCRNTVAPPFTCRPAEGSGAGRSPISLRMNEE
jgi:hypothetical protein